jgi:hypothetical protein
MHDEEVLLIASGLRKLVRALQSKDIVAAEAALTEACGSDDDALAIIDEVRAERIAA